MGAGIDVDMKVGMELPQFTEPRHQPVGREQGQHGELQAHQLGLAGGALHGMAELLERRADLGQQLGAVGIEQNRLVAPLEQGTADMAFERLHAAGQSGRGQSERFRRRLDRAQPGDLDESLHRGQRGQPLHCSKTRIIGSICAPHIFPSSRMWRFSAFS